MERSKLSLTTLKYKTLILAIIMMLPGIALGAKYFDDTFSSTFRSNGSNIATSGVLRLGNTETMGWRNFANGGNLLLSVDSSDRLLFNGVLIGTATSGSFQDSTFNIYDDGDATKKIAFQASGIGTTQTRTITMPNADVDLGGLTNSNIASGAGITYSKLSLTGGIVNADVSGSAAIAYSKLNLGSSIVNADIAAAAGIGVTKLAALTASRPVITDGSGFLTTEATLNPSRGGTGLNASASSGLLKFAIGTPTVSSGQVVNADVAAAAGIGVTKLEALTASRVAITDSSGFLTTEAALSIARGGTNNASLPVTAGGILYTDGTKVGNVGVGTTGQVLVSNGASAPTWGTNTATVQTYPRSNEVLTSGSAATWNKHYSFVVSSCSMTAGATYTHNSVTYTTINTISSGSIAVLSGSAAPLSSGTLTKSTGTGDASCAFTASASPLYLIVSVVGGGGGGACRSATSCSGGSAGGTSSWAIPSSTTLASAAGGSVGALNGPGGGGGACTINAPGITIVNQSGNGGGGVDSGTASGLGGQGAPGPFAGGPYAIGGTNSAAGVNAQANSGAGGTGAGNPGNFSGGGGGGGGFCVIQINSPGTSYTYTIGAAGSGSTGTATGGNGGTGIIIVEAYYQ